MATDAGRLPLTRDDLRQELATFRDEIRTHYATKADLSDLEVRLVKWMVSLMIGSVVAASAVAVLIHRLTG